MLRLVDPTNVADAASAGEGTCVERISPMEGEAIALALFPSARDQQFESLSLRHFALAAPRGIAAADPTVPPRRSREQSNAQNKGFEDFKGAAELVTRWSGQRHNGDGESEDQIQRWKSQHLPGRSTKEH